MSTGSNKTLTITVPTAFIEQANNFFAAYKHIKTVVCPEEKIRGLRAKELRNCRFCNRTHPATTFRSKAHIFPEQLGNRYLISDEECDNCNKIFSRFENDLAHFTGPLRHLQGVRGKERKSKFKTPDGKTRIGQMNDLGITDSISVSTDDIGSQVIEMDPKNGNGKVRFTKHSYIPLNVYKAVLKIAMSCLDPREIQDYQLAIRSLLTNRFDDQFRAFANLTIYHLPLFTGLSTPVGVIYEKKDKDSELFSHVFVMHFANQIWQLFLPLNKNDLHLFDGRELTVLLAPPLFADHQTAETIKIYSTTIALSSSELIKAEEETYTFEMDPKDLERAVILDPATGKTTTDTSTFSDVVKLVMVKSSTSFSLPIKDHEQD